MAHVGYFDGGSRGNPGLSGAGWILYDAAGSRVSGGHARVGSHATNNVAEYTGAIRLLETCVALGVRELTVRGDSTLVIEQIMGRYRCTKDHLRPLMERGRSLVQGFDRCDLEHVPRHDNVEADALSNLGMEREGDHVGLAVVTSDVFAEALAKAVKAANRKRRAKARKSGP